MYVGGNIHVISTQASIWSDRLANAGADLHDNVHPEKGNPVLLQQLHTQPAYVLVVLPSAMQDRWIDTDIISYESKCDYNLSQCVSLIH